MSDPTTNPCAALVDQHIAANRGEQPALKYGDKRYTFNDLAALTNRAGNVFRDLGVGVGDRVLVLVRPSPAYFAALLGAMKIGAVPVVAADSGTSVAAVDGSGDTKAIVVDEARVGDLGENGGAIVLVVAEEGGAHQSFVALLRTSASSLTAVPREAEAPGFVLLGSDGEITTAPCADLTAMGRGVLSGSELGGFLSILAGGDTVEIARTE